MRFTDLPPAEVVRPLAAWRDAVARDPAASDAVDALARRALALEAGPLVVVAGKALEAMWRHVSGSSLERGGLVVGTPVSAGSAAERVLLVHVTGAVGGGAEAATPLSLRLDAAIWSRANAALRPGETVVGWFHSHPGIGAFFSDTDRRTQAAFFAHAYSLGCVIDPVRGEQAWFAGPHARALPASSIVATAT